MRALRLASFALTGLVTSALLAPASLHAQQVDIKKNEKVKRDRYVITADEIAEHPDLVNGYDIIKVLRGQWLRITRSSGRALSGADASGPDRTSPDQLTKKCDPNCPSGAAGAGSGTPVPRESGSPYAESGATSNAPGQAGPVVYFNEIKQEGLNDLRSIRPSDIAEIRYMNGTEASGRYGSGHENGAILVKMRKPGT